MRIINKMTTQINTNFQKTNVLRPTEEHLFKFLKELSPEKDPKRTEILQKWEIKLKEDKIYQIGRQWLYKTCIYCNKKLIGYNYDDMCDLCYEKEEEEDYSIKIGHFSGNYYSGW